MSVSDLKDMLKPKKVTVIMLPSHNIVHVIYERSALKSMDMTFQPEDASMEGVLASMKQRGAMIKTKVTL